MHSIDRCTSANFVGYLVNIGFLYSPPLGVTGSPATDREALVALFKATNGFRWKHVKGWRSKADLKDWHGVNVNVLGRVVALRLRDNNLQGKQARARHSHVSYCACSVDGNELVALGQNVNDLANVYQWVLIKFIKCIFPLHILPDSLRLNSDTAGQPEQARSSGSGLKWSHR